MRARRRERGAPALADAGIALAAHAATVPGRRLAAFAGVRGEPPTLPLLDALVAAGREILLPVLLEDMDLDWALYTDERSLTEGLRGMREPAGPRLGRDAVATADLVLAPALAVDRAGNRLGQGGGSYDRALARTSAPVLAVLFDGEITESVPADSHDRPVDGVLTPRAGVTWLREHDRGRERSLP
jgi:5-formyltetrahydrofolate cyclo-ligase